MSRPPRVAVLLDENTSSGGTRYEAAKGYLDGIVRVGGAPFGVPYASALAGLVVDEFDALLTVGGRYAMPAEWYVGEPAPSPPSDRLPVEVALVAGFLGRDKPVLGICAGMQVLAALNGARLTAQVPEHNERGRTHEVRTAPGSQLAALLGERLSVNTFHNEAIVDPGATLPVAWADDGTIEAIELPGRRFAIGVQWHQELHGPDHPGEALFRGLIDACRTES
ncbi:gamma-glutamyl-gamma-aminobutyrate hydrolase family protein [Phenylobacterium sp.]|jgi:putative glutamine amidotransferase|uniref:gamma-glutamyl-gamma-aminobutyrate hydrolase family protein n=1 Tax=Phenylobacterium sp. TaxID=1871053 RepID=UPI002F93FD1F